MLKIPNTVISSKKLYFSQLCPPIKLKATWLCGLIASRSSWDKVAVLTEVRLTFLVGKVCRQTNQGWLNYRAGKQFPGYMSYSKIRFDVKTRACHTTPTYTHAWFSHSNITLLYRYLIITDGNISSVPFVLHLKQTIRVTRKRERGTR